MKTKLMILSALCLVSIGSIQGFGPGGGAAATRREARAEAMRIFQLRNEGMQRGGHALEMFDRGLNENDTALIKKAIALGIDINGKYAKYSKALEPFTGLRTPLMDAAISGQVNKVNLLLNLGANPNLVSENDISTVTGIRFRAGVISGGPRILVAAGSTALMGAILGTTVAADVYGEDKIENEKREAMLEDVIETLATFEGTDLDIKNAQGKTALMLAVESNKPVIVRILLNAGASLDITNNEGKTALDLAVNNPAIVTLIKNEYSLRRQIIAEEVGEASKLLPELSGTIAEYLSC